MFLQSSCQLIIALKYTLQKVKINYNYMYVDMHAYVYTIRFINLLIFYTLNSHHICPLSEYTCVPIQFSLSLGYQPDQLSLVESLLSVTVGVVLPHLLSPLLAVLVHCSDVTFLVCVELLQLQPTCSYDYRFYF